MQSSLQESHTLKTQKLRDIQHHQHSLSILCSTKSIRVTVLSLNLTNLSPCLLTSVLDTRPVHIPIFASLFREQYLAMWQADSKYLISDPPPPLQCWDQMCARPATVLCLLLTSERALFTKTRCIRRLGYHWVMAAMASSPDSVDPSTVSRNRPLNCFCRVFCLPRSAPNTEGSGGQWEVRLKRQKVAKADERAVCEACALPSHQAVLNTIHAQ